jgi:hypothetical protein
VGVGDVLPCANAPFNSLEARSITCVFTILSCSVIQAVMFVRWPFAALKGACIDMFRGLWVLWKRRRYQTVLKERSVEVCV